MKWLVLLAVACGKQGQPEPFPELPISDAVMSMSGLGDTLYIKGVSQLGALDLKTQRTRIVTTLPVGMLAPQGDHLLYVTSQGVVGRVDPSTGVFAQSGKVDVAPFSLAVVGEVAYVGSEHHVEIIDASGIRVLPGSELGFAPSELAVGGGRVFAANSHAPKITAIRDGKALDATPAQASISSLTAATDRLYWTTDLGEHLVSMPITGGALKVIATPAPIIRIATEGTNVALATATEILVLDKDQPVSIAHGRADALAIYAGVVYWADGNRLKSAPLAKP